MYSLLMLTLFAKNKHKIISTFCFIFVYPKTIQNQVENKVILFHAQKNLVSFELDLHSQAKLQLNCMILYTVSFCRHFQR